MGKLEGRIALITGASRGIGYFAALELARQGAHVIALARTTGGLEELDDAIKASGGTATLVPVDLTDYTALDRLGASIDERWNKLDILVGNAGILGGLSPVGHFDPKTFEKVVAINLTANWRLIRSLDPLMRASDAARALFMTSGVARSCKPFWAAYSTSKAGLEALVKTWANESQKTSIKANLFSPGATRTAMRAQAMPGEDPETLPHPSELAPKIAELVSPGTSQTGMLYDYRKETWTS